MSIKLRDLIRSVRACKTAAEERAVISKECALIRTAIKEENEKFRHRNVAKLLFIHMLGYPTHFGQMECLKLISATGFPEKRIGYLGLTLLLTEQTEVLTLVTNSLKVDLTNSNQYIVALSLIAIGNLATQDMSRDLASDVEKLLKSNNSYLRKKAALATIRLLKKEPDLIDHMAERITSLIKDRAHGVLITGLQLMIEVLTILPGWKEELLKLVPSLVRLLRNFISMGFSPEYDVGGIADPFMQVKILHLLRLLGKSNEEASEQMNDVLAQVASNTETSKNVGNAILYECVQTIMEVESDSSLKVLAVNILGRFLLNRDNNIRYVALNSLSRVITDDLAAVQRHRTTIVDCLKDPDISIRQRALELIFQLVNDQNVVSLTNELLNYLVVAQAEHKAALVSKIVQILEKYSSSKKWRIDTVITMLSVAGAVTDESVPRTAIIFIAQSEGLQGYATHRIYRSLLEDSSQLGLVQTAIWCIGEYGSQLCADCAAVDDTSSAYPAVGEDTVLNLLDKCSRMHNVDISTKGIVLNSLVKLTVRFSATSKQRILSMITPFQSSMSVELQQRSTEYAVLLNSFSDSLRKELLDRMPVLDESAIRRRNAAFDDSASSGDQSPTKNRQQLLVPDAVSSTGSATIDIDDIFGSLGVSKPVQSISAPQLSVAAHANSAGSNNLLDLDSIFGMSGAPVLQLSPTRTPTQQPVSYGNDDLLSQVFSSSANVPHTVPLAPSVIAATQPPLPINQGFPLSPAQTSQPMISTYLNGASAASSNVIQAYDKGGLQVLITLTVHDPSVICNARDRPTYMDGCMHDVSSDNDGHLQALAVRPVPVENHLQVQEPQLDSAGEPRVPGCRAEVPQAGDASPKQHHDTPGQLLVR